MIQMCTRDKIYNSIHSKKPCPSFDVSCGLNQGYYIFFKTCERMGVLETQDIKVKMDRKLQTTSVIV